MSGTSVTSKVQVRGRIDLQQGGRTGYKKGLREVLEHYVQVAMLHVFDVFHHGLAGS